MKRIPRRIFTAEFKREAIKLITKQGLTLAEAGKKLDVAKSGYQAWGTGKVIPRANLKTCACWLQLGRHINAVVVSMAQRTGRPRHRCRPEPDQAAAHAARHPLHA